MQFNYAEALGDDVLGTIASFLTEKKLPERSWIQYKYYHKICLEHDREWAEECDRKAHPITLQMYDTIIQSIDQIVAYINRPPIVFIKDDVAKELMKLYGGGWISDAQYYAVKKRCGIKADRPITSWVKKRKKKKRKKKLVDDVHKLEEQPVVEESREGSSSDSMPPSSNQKFEVQVNIGRYLLGGKRNKKYVVISKHLKSVSTPRTHNSRRKAIITKQKVTNYYKNKASSRGQKLPFYRLSISDTRRSLNFKKRLYNKTCQGRKVVRPAPTVKYKESRREEIRFDDDADWDVLNEAVAIAKQEALELESRATKEREDEEETAPSDTDKYDPVKEALDFLAVNGTAVGTSVGHAEQIRSQRYRRPVHPATLMTEELQFYRLCHIVALFGASNTKSKRIIKNMIRRMFLNIKIRPRRSRLAITSYYIAKVEDILSKYMYNQSRRVQSALEERVSEEKGEDDTHDTLSCTSSSSNTGDTPCGPYPSSLFYDENTNLNPRRYGLDRVDSSGACEVRCLYSSYVYQYSISPQPH